MKKLKLMIRNNEYFYLILTFIVPLLIMYGIYMFMTVYPFGRYSCMVLDLNGQYVYYFEKFRDIIYSGGSLIYSWERALGGEFLGIFSYYLCSPLTFLVCLFPKVLMTEALECLILVKMGLCGLTCGIYLHKSRPGSRLGIVLFSILYALSAYGVIQSMNTMWIDAMYLLPLLLLGIERLVNKGRFKLFTITLALILLTNFYIGYMMVIFTVIYYFCYYFSKYPIRRFRRFAVTSLRMLWFGLLAVLMAAVILIPAWYALGFGKTDFQTTDYSFFQRFDFLDFFVKMLPGSYDTVRPEGLPVVYCGMLTLILLPIYFITPGIRPRTKIASGVLLFLLVMSMNISTVDIFWHGLSKPNWLNYRYSFAFCLVVIIMAYEAFRRLSAIRYKAICTVGLVLFCMIMVVQKLEYDFVSDYLCIWVSLGAVGLYLAALYFAKNRNGKQTSMVALACVVVLESFSAGLINLSDLDEDVHYGKRDTYVAFMERLRAATDQINEDDTSLFRMEKTMHRKVNDPMALDMKGISHSTSTLNASVITLLQRLGYASRSHWSKYLGATPASDALLGIKYLITEETEDRTLPDRLYTQAYETDGDLVVYRNPYALSVLCSCDSALAAVDLDSFHNPFERLNAIVTAMLGSEEEIQLFRAVPCDISYANCTTLYTSGHRKYTAESSDRSATVSFALAAPTDAQYYVYFPSDYARECDLTLNYADYGTYFGNETRRIVDLGTFKSGQDIDLTLTLTEENVYIMSGTEYFYYLDEDVFNNTMIALSEGNMEISDWSDTKISGTVKTDSEHSLIYTSIPYDEGWKVKIDGESVPVIKTLGALLAIDVSSLPDGEHTLQMHYMPSSYLIGVGISFAAIVLFALSIFLSEFLRRRAAARRMSDGCIDVLSQEAAVEQSGEEPNPEAFLPSGENSEPPYEQETSEAEQAANEAIPGDGEAQPTHDTSAVTIDDLMAYAKAEEAAAPTEPAEQVSEESGQPTAKHGRKKSKQQKQDE